jgi:hypothetical protein
MKFSGFRASRGESNIAFSAGRSSIGAGAVPVSCEEETARAHISLCKSADLTNSLFTAWTVIRRAEKRMPAIAAARGVFNRARIKVHSASSDTDNRLLGLLFDLIQRRPRGLVLLLRASVFLKF